MFSAHNRESFISLYKTYVRPILEFASLIWCPYQQGLINEIENVQRRFTRLFSNFRSLPYRDRLKSLNLLSLSSRRLRYKLIFVYKMLHNRVDLDVQSFFVFASDSRTRGNSLKFMSQFARSSVFLHFFLLMT